MWSKFFFFNEALVEVEVKTLGVSEGREFSLQRFGRAGDLAIWQVDLFVFPQFGKFAEQNQMRPRLNLRNHTIIIEYQQLFVEETNHTYTYYSKQISTRV